MEKISSKALLDLKWNYNFYLSRYWKGCRYCATHKNEIDKWLKELLDILDNMNVLLKEIMKYERVNESQIEGGFDECKRTF